MLPTLALALPLALSPLTHSPGSGQDDCSASTYGGEFDCLTVPVFENRDLEEGREIELHVVILPALGDEVEPDPVFLIMGGPGQSAADKAIYFDNLMAGVRQHRDLVFVDVRGTGESNPLDFEIGPDDLMETIDSPIPPELVERELAKLKKKADLTQYTTNNAMDDLNDVRIALGYEKVNLYGGSYGTRAALVYLRRHPETVRTVLIKAVSPLGWTVGVDFARDAQASIERLFTDCAADPASAEKYGDLAARFDELLEKLAEPVVVETYHPLNGSTVEVPVSAEAVALTVRDMLYTGPDRSALPGMIVRGCDGQLDEWAERILRARLQQFAGLYEGMMLSVLAAEDLPLMNEEVIEATALDTFLGTSFAGDFRGALAVWPQAKVDPAFWEPVRSDAPVLLISGELDPVTPPRPAAEAAKHLPNSLHLVFPHGSHDDGPFRPCLDDLIEAFYRTGTVEGLDTSCVEQAGPVPFR